MDQKMQNEEEPLRVVVVVVVIVDQKSQQEWKPYNGNNSEVYNTEICIDYRFDNDDNYYYENDGNEGWCK